MGLLTGEWPTERNNTLGPDIGHFKSKVTISTTLRSLNCASGQSFLNSSVGFGAMVLVGFYPNHNDFLS